jgi:S-adenosylmethionine decarboxylase
MSFPLQQRDSVAATEQFGLHLMIDGYDADPAKLADARLLAHMLDTIPRAMGMHPICAPQVVEVGPKNRKDPGGLSGFVMIAESHLSFHTFPARGFVTIDLYTCQNDLNAPRLTRLLCDAFGMRDIDSYLQPRGQRYPAQNRAGAMA